MGSKLQDYESSINILRSVASDLAGTAADLEKNKKRGAQDDSVYAASMKLAKSQVSQAISKLKRQFGL